MRQWVDDYMVVRKELHEVEPAEGGCILILLAPAQLQVVSLDVISQSCDFIISYGQVEPFGESLEDRHDHGGRRAQPASRCGIGVGGDSERQPAGGVIAHDPVVNALVQVDDAVDRQLRSRIEYLALPDIGRFDLDPAVVGLFDRAICIEVNRGVEDQAPVEVAVRGYIAASSGQSQPQRGFAAYDHAWENMVFLW